MTFPEFMGTLRYILKEHEAYYANKVITKFLEEGELVLGSGVVDTNVRCSDLKGLRKKLEMLGLVTEVKKREHSIWLIATWPVSESYKVLYGEDGHNA